MRSIVVFAVIGGALAGGCAQPEDVTPIGVESNELGIRYITIEHETEGADRLLLIRGMKEDGTEIGTITLRTGVVSYTNDPDLADPIDSLGTELTVTVGDQSHPMVSPDRLPHGVAEPFVPALASFVRLGAVANAIRDEAGIWFIAPGESAGEVPYGHWGGSGPDAMDCDPALFPTSGGTHPQCCQDGNWMFLKVGSGVNANKFLSRVANWYPSTPHCMKSDNSTGCGVNTYGVMESMCFWGPCGTRIDQIGTSNDVVFFHPVSEPTWCGWDDNGTAAGAGAPESYDGTQTVYASVVPECPYTVCCTDGTAVASAADCIVEEVEATDCSGECSAGYSYGFNGDCYSCFTAYYYCQSNETDPQCGCAATQCGF